MDVSGLFVPLLTPLGVDGSLDPDVVAPHVERLLDGGVHGFISLGTTGEFADLTADERVEVITATVKVVDGRVPVFAGTGGVGTAESCHHARAARDAGVDGVLALPPLYWKLSGDALVAHFSSISDAAGLPVLLYDYPSLSGTALTPSMVARLATEVTGVRGIKLSGTTLKHVHEVLGALEGRRSEFAVMVGSADVLVPALLAGVDGTILALANVAPRLVADLLRAAAGDDLAALRDHQRRLLELARIAALASPPILALKAAARAAGSPFEPVVRTRPNDPQGVIDRAAQLTAALLS